MIQNYSIALLILLVLKGVYINYKIFILLQIMITSNSRSAMSNVTKYHHFKQSTVQSRFSSIMIHYEHEYSFLYIEIIRE